MFFQVDKVYYISRCQLKTANKQYTSLKNDYEMTFNSDTVVAECTEDASSLPTVKYDFVPINMIAEKSPDTIIGKTNCIFRYKNFCGLKTLTYQQN